MYFPIRALPIALFELPFSTEQMASQVPGPSSNQNRPTYSRNVTVTRYKEENSRSRKNPFQDK